MKMVFIGNPSPRNQVVKHYLLQWHYFDSNINHLTGAETVKAKILYTALKHLAPEERRFLANKYRAEKKLNDALIARKYGMTMTDYRNKRIYLEDKLRPFIVEASEQYQVELSKQISLEYSK